MSDQDTPPDATDTPSDGAPIPPVDVVTKAPVPYIYIGPNSPKIGAYSLSIYPELPPLIVAAIAANPALNALFPTLDQWRSLKDKVISPLGNMTYTGSTKHAVEFLRTKGVL